ncbi:ELWxxDGT repeat protein [Tunicatimonas pelagia]|uniref:ELWxxDGT repeat protein n=1 Tax=Tunicatimonas pelagia TaxID=931531 RepID=UPI00266708A1|nr:ELWxxDGT repeat protein [Tunicatimonas pelagia]WKN43304.1 YCF48-related protein [Tunicatimonas pelagia]
MRITIIFVLLSTASTTTLAQLFLKEFKSTGESISFKNELYFAAEDQVHGMELWRSDGTVENTVLVKDITIGENGSSPKSFLVYNDQLLFSANDVRHGTEVWITDGTEEGTRLLVDHIPGTNSLNPRNWVVYQNRLLVLGNRDEVFEVFPSENRVACFPDCDRQLRAASLFTTSEGLYSFSDHREELSIYDESEQRFEPINAAGFENITRYRHHENRLYVAGSGKIGRVNEATREITVLSSWTIDRYGRIEVDNLTGVGDLLFFSVRLNFNRDNGGTKDSDALWVTDGTVQGTQMLKSFSFDPHAYNSEIMNFAAANGKLYFVGRTGYSSSANLWVSDGTEAGTQNVSDVVVVKYDDRDEQDARLTEWKNQLYGRTPVGLGIYDLNYPDSLYLFGGDFQEIDFKAGVGEDFYFAGVDRFHQDLWVDIPQPKISVSHSQLDFSALAADSCAQKTIRISNIGRKNLYLSDVTVSGNAYYISSDSDSPLLRPGESSDVQLTFFPDTAGLHDGLVSIVSNDQSEPTVNIPVSGASFTQALRDSSYCFGVATLTKKVTFSSTAQAIKLTKSTIDENQPSKTVVGVLSVSTQSQGYTFSLVPGEGDRDNRYFSISGNQLLSSQPIDFESTPLMSVRVKAESTQSTAEEVLLIAVTDVEENISVVCEDNMQYLDQKLEDVAFLDNNVVVAAGPNNIIKSTDGGTNWTDITPNLAAENYHTVQYPGDGYLYVTGSSFILKTDDLGEKWQILKISQQDDIITSLSFSDQNHAFVSTHTGNIYQSTDQGGHWKFQGAIDVGSRSYDRNNINVISFVDSLYGLAGDHRGKLYKTSNGGKDWSELSLNGIDEIGAVIQLQLLSRDVIYMVNRGGRAYKSTTGGNNWIPVSTIQKKISHLHMLDEQRGFFFNQDEGLYESTDGGNQWNLVCQSRGEVWGMATNEAGNNVIAVGQAISNYWEQHTHKLILASRNSVWETVSVLEIDQRTRLNMINKSSGFVKTNSYQGYTTAFITYDAGLTWKPFPLPTNDQGDLSMYNEKIGFYFTNDILYKTEDGGNNWNSIVNSRGIQSIKFLNDQIVLASSYKEVSRSTDGGNSWETILTNNESEYFHKLDFVNNTTGFIKRKNVVYKTEDQGKTWKNIFFDENIGIKGFDFLDANLGFLWSYERKYDNPAPPELYRTVDGGNNWEEIRRENNQQELTPTFLNKMIGWASFNSTIYYTEDGGRNWLRRYTTSDDAYLINVDGDVFISSSSGFADDARVLRKLEVEFKPVVAGNIVGEREVVGGSTYHYQAQTLQNATYQWSSTGGTIKRSAGPNVWVQWDAYVNENTLTLSSISACGTNMTTALNLTKRPMRTTPTDSTDNVEEEIITGGIQPSDVQHLLVYPNPVTQTLFIDLSQFRHPIEYLKVYNQLGKTIVEINRPVKNEFSIDFSGYKNGVYLIKAWSRSSHHSFKVLKVD